MTVYKAIKKEADAAAKLAIALVKGETPEAPDSVNNGTKDVPSVFEEPVAVTKDNIGEYLGEPDFPKKEEICAGKLAAKCDGARALGENGGPAPSRVPPFSSRRKLI